MKVKFTVRLKDEIYEEIKEIDENKFKKCEGYSARNMMASITSDWADNVIESSYQVIEDERFDDEEDNLPYLNLATKHRLGWE